MHTDSAAAWFRRPSAASTCAGNASPALWATVEEGTNLTDPDLAQMVRDGSQLKVPGQVGGVGPAVLDRRSRNLEPIFVTCAGPYVRVQDSLELALQSAFVQQHHAQVQALEALTHRIIRQQERLDGMPVTW